MSIPTVNLAGKQVGRVGLGLMQLTWNPTPPPEEQSFAAIKAATDAGATTWSTATFYGNTPDEHRFDNLALIGRFFKAYPEYKGKVQLVVKGGVNPEIHPTNDINVNRELLKKTKSLLGEDVAIDVYSPARLAPGVDPVEYFAPFEELRKEGLFGALGASETNAATLRALAKVYTISVVEIEVSLWSWAQEIQDVVAWSAETAVPVFAYSPFGRGFITRTFKSPEDIPEGSFQKYQPRFQGEAFYHNLKLVDLLDEIAAKKKLTTSQLAIAWVLSLSPYTIPIPGSSNAERARQNTEAASIVLAPEDIAEINTILDKFELKGGRYMDALAGHLML